MYQRIIVKVGSSVISKDGVLNLKIVQQLVDQIVTLRKKGIEIIFVTSGAVATGRGVFTVGTASGDTVQKQVYAAIGQVKLMSIYADAFAKLGYVCAQVLMTKEDFRDEQHYANMKNCLESLLVDGVVPVVNENDVTAITELLFTDNDELAGLVAQQLHADAVIILTSVDGVLAGSPADTSAEVISEIDFGQSADFEKYITSDMSAAGRGGMHTKFAIARQLAMQGIVTHIANGKKSNVLLQIIEGKKEGTKFLIMAEQGYKGAASVATEAAPL